MQKGIIPTRQQSNQIFLQFLRKVVMVTQFFILRQSLSLQYLWSLCPLFLQKYLLKVPTIRVTVMDVPMQNYLTQTKDT